MVKTSIINQEVLNSSKSRYDSIKFKGVRKRNWGKWVSEIRLPNSRERIWLGSYDSPEKAARAFDAAQFCLRGSKANLNFPGSPPDIAGGPSMTSCEIQTAAARFANLAVTAKNISFETPDWPAVSQIDRSDEISFVESDSVTESVISCSPCILDQYMGTTSQTDGNSDEFKSVDQFDTLTESWISYSQCILDQTDKLVESDTQTESVISYSPCISEVTVQTDSEAIGVEESFYEELNLCEVLGSGNYVSEFGYFSGFDEYSGGEYYTTLLQSENFDYGVEDTYDASVYQDSSLWNF